MSDETPTPESPMSSRKHRSRHPQGASREFDQAASRVQLPARRVPRRAERDQRRARHAQEQGRIPRRPGRPDRRARGHDPRPGPLRQVRRAGHGVEGQGRGAQVALADAQTLAGYKVEGDEIDDHALQTVVAKLKTEVDYAFDPEESGTRAHAPRAARDAARPTSRTKYGLDVGTRPSRPAADEPAATRAATARSSPRRCGPTPSSCSIPRTARSSVTR